MLQPMQTILYASTNRWKCKAERKPECACFAFVIVWQWVGVCVCIVVFGCVNTFHCSLFSFMNQYKRDAHTDTHTLAYFVININNNLNQTLWIQTWKYHQEYADVVIWPYLSRLFVCFNLYRWHSHGESRKLSHSLAISKSAKRCKLYMNLLNKRSFFV